jgi:stringent starvation protein B
MDDSTKPYFIRAVHEWCTDQGYTPYLVVSVDARCKVPERFVQNGKITLNVSLLATNAMSLGKQKIEFEASFGGVVQTLLVPIDRVEAIYARENKEGLWFEVAPPVELGLVSSNPAPLGADGVDADTNGVDADKPVNTRSISPVGIANNTHVAGNVDNTAQPSSPELPLQGEPTPADRENMPKIQPARGKPHLTVVK